jgi:hypothetical protein
MRCVFVRCAWLYTRATDSVRIEARDEGNRYLLVVHGPGNGWHHQVCADYAEAVQAQMAYEAQLIAQSFILEGFEQWEPQRRTPRAAPAVRRGRGTAPDSSTVARPDGGFDHRSTGGLRADAGPKP